MVDALEEGLTRMETNDAENLELCNKVWDCEEDDATNTTTSSEYSPISDTTPWIIPCFWPYAKNITL